MLKIPLCYHCCLKKLAVAPVALHLVHTVRYQFRCHDDSFAENAPDDKATKNRMKISMNWNNVLLCLIQCNHIRFRLCVCGMFFVFSLYIVPVRLSVPCFALNYSLTNVSAYLVNCFGISISTNWQSLRTTFPRNLGTKIYAMNVKLDLVRNHLCVRLLFKIQSMRLITIDSAKFSQFNFTALTLELK